MKIDNLYNQKFRDFFAKYDKQFEKGDTETKKMLFDIAVEFVEKNRDFVMQYPLIQYWSDLGGDYQARQNSFFEEYEDKEINVYFHIPFCKTRCTYCNFHIGVGDKLKKMYQSLYIKRLKDEVEEFLKNIKNIKIKTIFIGGGTPSYLSKKELEELLVFINKKMGKFFVAKDFEFTFEGNPDSFDEEKLKIMKKNSINRISYGVQTFDDDIIKKINRTYDQAEINKKIILAKKIGFENINLDMIYGLPGHNYKIMLADLKKAAKSGVSHLTYYPLYYYDESILSKIGENRDNIKQIYNFYDEVLVELKKEGFIQYGREYFSKNIDEIHHYQSNYVSNSPLIGFGHSAYSFNGKNAFLREQNMKKYFNNKDSIIKEIKYNSDILDRRLFVLGSRNIKIYKKNIKDLKNTKQILNLPIKLGLIQENPEYFILTNKGLKYQEIVAHMFL